MIEDIISVFPKTLKDGDAEYVVYVEYHPNANGKYVWVVIYLNSSRLFYRDEQENFEDLKNNFLKKFNNKNF